MVDYPNSKKARKMYLCLMVGSQEVVPSGIVEGEEMTVESKEKLRQEVRNERRRRKEKTGGSSGKKRKKKTKGKKRKTKSKITMVVSLAGWVSLQAAATNSM